MPARQRNGEDRVYRHASIFHHFTPIDSLRLRVTLRCRVQQMDNSGWDYRRLARHRGMGFWTGDCHNGKPPANGAAAGWKDENAPGPSCSCSLIPWTERERDCLHSNGDWPGAPPAMAGLRVPAIKEGDFEEKGKGGGTKRAENLVSSGAGWWRRCLCRCRCFCLRFLGSPSPRRREHLVSLYTYGLELWRKF